MEAHAASRYERDMQAMKDWPEYTQLLDMTRKMLKCVTKPPTAHGTIIALGALGDFATMLETITPPQGLASRGSRHAAILISEVLQQCLAEADLENAPAVAQDYLADKEKDKAWAALGSYLGAPGTDVEPQSKNDDVTWDGSNVVLHLSRVQILASQLTHKAALLTPVVACSLSQDMLLDRAQHPLFFQAAEQLQAIHGNLFASRRDPLALWSHHMETSGRMAHPARPNGDIIVFDVNEWMASLQHPSLVSALGHMMSEYPLPDYTSLRFCFKTLSSYSQAPRGQKRSRNERDRSYSDEPKYLDRDTVNALALLCGDLVYSLTLHLGDILPPLAHGPNRPIHHKDVESRTLLLGLFFQLAINYQTSHLGLTFDEFLLNEVNHSISYPVTGAPNYKKLITLALAQPDLGPKRRAALPYLFTSRGLRGYHSFLSDPDLYISRLQCLPGIFLDECTAAVQEAQHRVTLRTQKAVHDTQGAISGGSSFNSAASSDPVRCKIYYK